MLQERFSRRSFGKEAAKIAGTLPFTRLSGINLFPPEHHESLGPPTPGDVLHLRNGKSFVVKKELDTKGNPILIRYEIPDFYSWALRVGFRKLQKEITDSDISRIQLAKIPQEQSFKDWTGEKKRHNREGGIKFMCIPGMFTETGDPSFQAIKTMLKKELGYDDSDFLESTYNQDPKSKTGKKYIKADSLQDPLQSLEVMDKLLYRWKKQCPLEKAWLIGHSQGGWLSFELAKRHPDAVAGVIMLDAPVKGADFTFLPQDIERLVGKIIGEKAAEFFISRAGIPGISERVEREAQDLQNKGIPVVSICSTEDDIVKYPGSFINSSNRFFSCQEIPLAYKMGSWREWKVAKDVARDIVCKEFKCLPWGVDLYFSNDSARLQIKVGERVGFHGAVLTDPIALKSIKFTISGTTPHLPTKPGSSKVDPQKSEEIFKQIYQPLFKKTPYRDNPDFEVDYTNILTLEVKIKNPNRGRVVQEVESWLKANCVDPGSHHINYR